MLAKIANDNAGLTAKTLRSQVLREQARSYSSLPARWLSPGHCASLGARFQLSSPMAFSYRLLIAPTIFAICGAAPAQAFDLSTQGVVASAYATSKVTSAPFDRKLILAAQDDAAVFIATDGQWRGARLESALDYLRRTEPKLKSSDLELAQAILVQ